MKQLICLIFLTFTLVLIGQEKQPNVLFIMVDDLRTELNTYGADYIQSPNIDKIASEGIQFNYAYCQQSVCSASRASMLSGVRPNTTGVDYPYSLYYMTEFRPNHNTIAEEFEAQGYHVKTFGKIHHGSEDKIKNKHYNPKGWTYYAKEENIKLGGKKGRNKQTPQFEAADVEDNAYFDGMLAEEAVKQLKGEQNTTTPFFYAVGFKKPHLPFNAPKKYFDLYNPKDIGLAPNTEPAKDATKWSNRPYALSKYKGPNDNDGKKIPEEHQLKLRHAYAACVSYIDAQIGKLMQTLDEIGKKENTIVVLVSDHGWHLGHQGMWGKTTNFENATRAPLIISAPNHLKNIQLDQLVEYVDIYPTLLDLTGLKTVNYLEGNSMKPIMENPDLDWKTAAFSQFNRGKDVEGYTMKTKDFRYTEWHSKSTGKVLGVELYDHQIDYLETKNVAHLPEYSEIVVLLQRQLAAGWKAALPDRVTNNANNPEAPPHVSWGPEAKRIFKEKKNKKDE